EAACGRSVPTIVSEKPLVLTEHQYERVASARAAAGNRVISVNNWMHSDLNRHVRVLLDEEVIGKVRSIFLRTGRNAAALGHDSWSPRWRTDPAHSGGGIILDHGWHQLYLLLGWMNEPVQEVSAQTRTSNPRNYPVEDEAGIVLKFASGCSSIELTWTSSGRSNDGYITGDRGQIAIHDDRVVVHNGEVERSLPFKGRLTESSYHPDWFREVFRYNVLDENRREADRNFAEAGVLVSTIAAAYRSAQAHGEPRRPKQFESSLSTAEEGLVRGNVMRGGWDSPS
ncbi:MAG: Gfo/Idh/MocA family protein, partial [Chloroflexota bacterium]